MAASPPAEPSDDAAWAQRLSAANIHPQSHLATDYLNHYNEVIMLLEMAMDMPEMLDDAADWYPITYPEHFKKTGFPHKALALEAHARAPQNYRQAFEKACDALDTAILGTIKAAQSADGDTLTQLLSDTVPMLHSGAATINGIILGRLSGRDNDAQADIDALFD